MKTEIVGVKTAKDQLIYGALFTPEKKSTVAIILKHGAGGTFTGSPVLPFAELLCKRGYTTLSVNTRNSGSGYAYSLFEWIEEDLNSWIKFLNEKGFDNIVLHGHSLGTGDVPYYVGKTKNSFVKAVVVSGAHMDFAGAISIDKFKAIDPTRPPDVPASYLGEAQKLFDEFASKCKRLKTQGQGMRMVEFPFHGPFTALRREDPNEAPNWSIPQGWQSVCANMWLSYFGPDSVNRPIKWYSEFPKNVPVLTIVHGVVNTAACPYFSKEIVKAGRSAGLRFDYIEIKEAPHSFAGYEDEAVNAFAKWLEEIGLPPNK